MTQLLKDNHNYQLIEDTVLGGMKLPKGLWIKIEYHKFNEVVIRFLGNQQLTVDEYQLYQLIDD